MEGEVEPFLFSDGALTYNPVTSGASSNFIRACNSRVRLSRVDFVRFGYLSNETIVSFKSR